MSHDHDEPVACATCDLAARLESELTPARALQVDFERRFHDAAIQVAEGLPEVPPAVRRGLQQSRDGVAAFERMLEEVLVGHGESHASIARAN